MNETRHEPGNGTSHQRLLDAVCRIQDLFISREEPEKVFRRLLDTLCDMTESRYGFLAEYLARDGGPALRVLAISDVAWNHGSRKLYRQVGREGMTFRDFSTLLCRAARDGTVVISNDPATDIRARGLPPGHPPITAFLGLPVFFGGELVGVAGVANRNGGYDGGVADFLRPFLSTCGAIISAVRDRYREAEASRALRESEKKYRKLFDTSPVALFEEDLSAVRALFETIDPPGGDFRAFLDENPAFVERCLFAARVIDVNRAACELHGAENRQALLQGLQVTFTASSLNVLKAGLVAMWRGETRFESEAVVRRLDGEERVVILRWVVQTGHEADYARVVVSLDDITERRRAADRLRAAVSEKETLIREVHHRVKNNFQVVSSLINLQAARFEEPVLAAAFADTRQRIRAMALVHESLYRAGTLSRIRVRDYLSRLVESLVRSFPPRPDIACRVEAGEETLPPDVAVHCGLIVNELVSNALRHAFRGRRRGRITVAYRALTGHRQELAVSDDGIGMSGEIVPRTAASLGLQLVETLAVRQLGGSLDVDRGEGTRIRVTFKPTVDEAGPKGQPGGAA